MPAVTVVIPAYNESAHIPATLGALRTCKQISEILLVDDGSQDDTARLAREGGARVLMLPQNTGKGGAITAAFPEVRGDVVLLLDADLEETAPQALALVDPIIAGEADLTIASFTSRNSGQGFGAAKKFARLGIRLLTGRTLLSPLSGQRCMKKKVLGELLPLAPRFGVEVGMTIDALRRGYRVLEIDTGLTHCPPGRNWQGFVHRGKQFYDICTAMGYRVGRSAR